MTTDDSLGGVLPESLLLPINQPTVPAIASRATASTATSTTRERRGGTVSGCSSVVMGVSRSVVIGTGQPEAGANSGLPNVLFTSVAVSPVSFRWSTRCCANTFTSLPIA